MGSVLAALSLINWIILFTGVTVLLRQYSGKDINDHNKISAEASNFDAKNDHIDEKNLKLEIN